jgi:hypothetical protein
MPYWLSKRTMQCITIGIILSGMTVAVWGQEIRGKINVTVLDPQQAIVPGASLELVDLATNEVRTATTQSAGTYTFVNLPPGKYKLTVSNQGFRKAIYDEVTVSATKATDIITTLVIGAPTETVTVDAVAPLVEATSVAISAVIDLKQIEGLPLQGRNIANLSRLVPGYTGTWNGLPSMAQGNNVDGVIGSTSRMKFGGNSNPAVQVRLENIEEMTVQTDQMDENQGFGMSAMQSNFITRRGTNEYHGQFFWDHQNDNLNANSWASNWRGLPKAEFKLNEFGGSVGGPVFRDKLFFFFSLSTARQPGGGTTGASILTSSAQQGNFTYVGSDGQTRTVNVFNLAKAYDATLPGTTNGVIAAQMTRINSSVGGGSREPITIRPSGWTTHPRRSCA